MKTKRGQVKLLFKSRPKNTHYKPGCYSWVNEPEAKEYIDSGDAELVTKTVTAPKPKKETTKKKEKAEE